MRPAMLMPAAASLIRCYRKEKRKMGELLSWLKLQNGGVRTFREFQRKSLALAANEPDHAALLRLLGDLAGRFADAYDGCPLPADVGVCALARLAGLLEKAAEFESAAPGYLPVLNEAGLAELA
jgi:hypothetical protein